MCKVHRMVSTVAAIGENRLARPRRCGAPTTPDDLQFCLLLHNLRATLLRGAVAGMKPDRCLALNRELSFIPFIQRASFLSSRKVCSREWPRN